MDIGMRTYMYNNAFCELGENPYKKMKEYGYTQADLGLADTDKPEYTLPFDEAKKIIIEHKKLIDEAGVEVCQVHGPWCWPPKESFEGGLEKRMEEMKRGVECTALLDCKHFVLHPVMPYLAEEAGTEDEPKTWEANIKFMRELTSFAKEKGVIICVENMPMPLFSIAKPCDILRLVEEINDDNFQVCLDTGHVAVFEGMDIKEEVLRLGEHIRTLHVHDNCVGPDIHLIPHCGDICWSDFADALREINYKGVFTLEVKPPDTLPLEIREDLYKIMVKIANSIINE